MYLLDANVFIQSKQAHYGLDFVPAFWDWLDRAYDDGTVRSIRPISDELAAGEDELSEWAASRTDLFLPMDGACGPSLAALAGWANLGHFTPAAVAEFLASGDYQLIGYAHAHGLTVVTMEKSEPARKSKVKIPDACIAHGVEWTSPFQMLREENARFVLS
jgi:hypothetical protein